MTEADSHDLIRVHGARVNNLKDVSVEIPKRRLTAFTGVSGSGKSSLVFDTIAAESQRLINETYSAFVQGFMSGVGWVRYTSQKVSPAVRPWSSIQPRNRPQAAPSPSKEPACTARATRPPGNALATTSPSARTARCVGNPTSRSTVSVGRP